MKVQVLQETLAAALRDTVRAVGKSTLPVLENVLVATDEGRLRLTATNLEYGIACWLDAKVEEEGAITVPAKTFAALVKTLTAETVTLKTETKTKDGVEIVKMKVSAGKQRSTFRGIKADEFPPMRVPGDEAVSFTVDADKFQEALVWTAFTAASENGEYVRYVLTGILLHGDPDKDRTAVTISSADGFRMGQVDLPIVGTLDKAFKAVIPAKALSKFVSLDISGEIKITVDGSAVLIQGQDFAFWAMTIEGEYPDLSQVVPKPTTTAVVEKAALLAALKRIQIVAEYPAKLGWNATERALIAERQSAEVGETRSRVALRRVEMPDGQEYLAIGFNPKYLQQITKACPSDQIVFGMTDATHPALITPEGYTGNAPFWVVMPMTLE